MSVAKELKAAQIEDIKKAVQGAKSLVLVEYEGINVEQDTKLRSDFRANNVKYQVLKNRLVKRALNELGYNEFDSYLEKTTAIAFANGDELAAAKVVAENAKTVKVLKAKCGLLDGKFIDANVVNQIANIPSKDILLCQLCGVLQSGISGLARALSQIAENKEN
ncbi:MAG: 50S ribosomal protein L10 [Clostridia bacterium]|nr:50S ribosomal protein L10 [Clostridia bacterium]